MSTNEENELLCQLAGKELALADANKLADEALAQVATLEQENDRLREGKTHNERIGRMDEVTREIVRLAPNMTLVGLDESRRQKAIDLALRITMSPHEWTWKAEEQFDMAAYVLWAHQRLSGIKQLVDADLQQCGD